MDAQSKLARELVLCAVQLTVARWTDTGKTPRQQERQKSEGMLLSAILPHTNELDIGYGAKQGFEFDY